MSLVASSCVVVLAVAAGAPYAAGPDGQITAPPMGTSKDLETWTRDVGEVPDIEHGLGLHVSGDFTMLVTFAGTRLRRDPRAPVKEVVVIAKPAAGLDPGRVLSPTLMFLATGKDKKQVAVNVTDRVTTYPPGPFATMPASVSARAALTAEEFLKLVDATDLRANMLGMQVTFRPDQIKALRALGERVGLVGR
jgi:hypothetical protein